MSEIMRSGYGASLAVRIAAAALALGAAGMALAQHAARVEDLNGIAWAVRADGSFAPLAPNAAVATGDTLRTERDSTVRLRFADGTMVALRPLSAFRVDAFRYADNAPQQDVFAVQLLKGGFRQVTGLLARRNPKSFSASAGTSTIGIRGTDFSVRMCAEDCAAESAEPAAPQALEGQPAARVVLLQGVAVAQAATAGRPRQLAQGSTLYEHEFLATAQGSQAVLVFRDDTRVTLEQGSVFEIAAYRYDKAEPRASAARLRLLNGYAHVATGALAKLHSDALVFESALGTIRPRGTGFSFGGCVGNTCASVSVSADSGGASVTTTTSNGDSSTTTSTSTTNVGNSARDAGAKIGGTIGDAASAAGQVGATIAGTATDIARTSIADAAGAVESGLSTGLPAVVDAARAATSTDPAARVKTLTGDAAAAADSGAAVVVAAVIDAATSAVNEAARIKAVADAAAAQAPNLPAQTPPDAKQVVQAGLGIGEAGAGAVIGAAADLLTGSQADQIALMAAVLDGIKTMTNESGRVFTDAGAGAKSGLTAFGENLTASIESKLVAWLSGGLTDAGIPLPQNVSLRSLLQLFLNVGAVAERNIMQRMERNFGPGSVEFVHLLTGLATTYISEGAPGFWRAVSANLNGAGPHLAAWVQQTIESARAAKAEAEAEAAKLAANVRPRESATGSSDKGADSGAPVAGQPATSTVRVWDGSVELARDKKIYVVEKGAGLVLRAGGSLAQTTTTTQPAGGATRPDLVKIGLREVFGEAGGSKTDSGVYVVVYDGAVSLTQAGAEVVLVKGETGFADAKANPPQRLDTAPLFLRNDALLGAVSLGVPICRP
jgi:hypothetical protein